MPKVIRKAVVTLTAAELSKALGIPFGSVENVEWHTDADNTRGLKLTISTEEELDLPRLLPNKKK